MSTSDDPPAASAFCVTCGGDITFQGDRPPHWCHDARPDRDADHTASPRGPGRLFRCPTLDPSGGNGFIGCGATFIATPDHEGAVDCPSCGMWFMPTASSNAAEQPSAGAQPQEVQ